MSQILVITGKEKVFTTFYKTIHFSEPFTNDSERENALTIARSIAFSLACTDHRPACDSIDNDNIVSQDDVFDLLEKRHSK